MACRNYARPVWQQVVAVPLCAVSVTPVVVSVGEQNDGLSGLLVMAPLSRLLRFFEPKSSQTDTFLDINATKSKL